MAAVHELADRLIRFAGAGRQFVLDRTVFGRPLAERQYVAFRLTELQAEVDLLRSHNLVTCEALMAGDDITRPATVAKLKAGRLIRLTSIGGGADEIMLQVLARLDGLPA